MRVKDFNQKMLDTGFYYTTKRTLEAENSYNFYVEASYKGFGFEIIPGKRFELSDYNIDILAKIASLYADLIPARDKYNDCVRSGNIFKL